MDKIFIAHERGRRLKTCRVLLNKTLQELAHTHNISYSTLSSWERGAIAISEKNIEKIISILNSEGLHCSKEWILEEKGKPPHKYGETILFQAKNSNSSSVSDISPQLAIFNEIEFFKRNNKGCLVKIVDDDSMHPHYKAGDYIGGLELPVELYHKLNGELCIVDLKDKHMIRRVLIKPPEVILISSNMTDYPEFRVLNLANVKLYPIVFHRRNVSYTLLDDSNDIPSKGA